MVLNGKSTFSTWSCFTLSLHQLRLKLSLVFGGDAHRGQPADQLSLTCTLPRCPALLHPVSGTHTLLARRQQPVWRRKFSVRPADVQIEQSHMQSARNTRFRSMSGQAMRPYGAVHGHDLKFKNNSEGQCHMHSTCREHSRGFSITVVLIVNLLGDFYVPSPWNL